ncbi:MAG TPA: hypothetical protein PKU91_11075, partial [Phycisphaerales bacterium]|nr:hypothetical protein [Phycisphaerales bacterium]
MTKHMFQVARWWGAGRVASSVRVLERRAAASFVAAVAALSGPIPSGTILYFGESKDFATLAAAAAAGATSLTVQALPQIVESGDKATYAGAGTKKKVITSGTLLGRTYAERDANTPYGP